MEEAICHSSDCIFSCDAVNVSTSKLKKAIEWLFSDFSVKFYYKGKFIGYSSFCLCDGNEDFVKARELYPYGTIYFVKSENSYYINIPDELLS